MSKRSKKSGKGETAVLSFHNIGVATLVGGNLSYSATPTGLSSRALAEADAWSWFRLTALKFRIFAYTLAAAVGYVEGVPDTLPTTQGTISELISSVFHNATLEHTWSRWVTIPASRLRGQLEWYKAIAGSQPSGEEVPGTFVIAGTGTNTVAVEAFFTIEFKGPVATANTPLFVEMAAKLRAERIRVAREAERKQLLLALGSSTAAP